MFELLATIAIGAVDVPFTVTVTLAQPVVPQDPPSALTKYVAVPAGERVIEAPVPMAVPEPQPPLYHVQTEPSVPSVPVTDSVTGAPVQMVAGVAATLTGSREGVVTLIIVC
jgi:hypothetical protein